RAKLVTGVQTCALQLSAGSAISSGVGFVAPAQHRVVVQHDLKVRHEPELVGAVAMKPAPELIADPAVRHRVEGVAGHLHARFIRSAERRVRGEYTCMMV